MSIYFIESLGTRLKCWHGIVFFFFFSAGNIAPVRVILGVVATAVIIIPLVIIVLIVIVWKIKKNRKPAVDQPYYSTMPCDNADKLDDNKIGTARNTAYGKIGVATMEEPYYSRMNDTDGSKIGTTRNSAYGELAVAETSMNDTYDSTSGTKAYGKPVVAKSEEPYYSSMPYDNAEREDGKIGSVGNAAYGEPALAETEEPYYASMPYDNVERKDELAGNTAYGEPAVAETEDPLYSSIPYDNAGVDDDSKIEVARNMKTVVTKTEDPFYSSIPYSNAGKVDESKIEMASNTAHDIPTGISDAAAPTAAKGTCINADQKSENVDSTGMSMATIKACGNTDDAYSAGISAVCAGRVVEASDTPDAD